MKTEKSKSVPELRFSGFVGEWKSTTISEVGKVVTGGTPDTSNRSLYGGNFMFVSPSDIGNARYVNVTSKTLTEAGHKTGRRIPKGSILFVCIGSTIGKVAQATAECTTNQQINAVVPKENHHANFLHCLFDKESAPIRLLAGKQAVPIINKSTFSSIAITLPTLPEQRKIADFLTAVDGRIGQLIQKKALLEDYKKGVMQHLFTQAIRFKDDHGNDFPDWEEKKLGELGDFKSGVGFSESEQGGKVGIPFYKVSDMNLVGNETSMNSANHYVSDAQIAANRYKVISDESLVFAKGGAAIFLERKRVASNFLIDTRKWRSRTRHPCWRT
jgi:type I restriction enzyme S subunit